MLEKDRPPPDVRASEARLRAVLDAALDAVIAMDVDDVITYWNPRAETIFGWAREEALGKRVRDLIIPERFREAHSKGLARFLATGVGPVLNRRIELQGLRRDGTEFPVELSITAVKEDGTYSFSAFLADLTERKAVESQLRHAQKMEAVGRLAGGVAHDFNNSLGVVLGYTELLLRHASEAQRGKLEAIRAATERAAGLTRQLLAFGRKQIVNPQVLDLNLLVSDLETVLVRLMGEDVALAIVAGAELGQVKADRGQLEQVVLNLCANAREAMPRGGRLVIETANAELTAAPATPEPLTPGPHVMLAVTDTGAGIEKDALPKVFEPFYTTKAAGQGPGLGLATVHGIVKQAGGHVTVESEVGRGTTFKVYLPRIDQASLAPPAPEAVRPSKVRETILLVEDEGSLRDIAREILQEEGYLVLEAASPREAIDIAHRNPGPIRLLVTDVVMPGMNGRALAEALAAACPAVRVLYMSGYSNEVIAQRGVLPPGALLLEKPFTALALLSRVRAALLP